MLTPRPVLLAAALLLLDGNPIRIDEIVVRGKVHPATREVSGTITTAVRIPFGSVPVTGRASARYHCDATFSGTVGYGSVVRLLARLKGVGLVDVMEGRIESEQPWECSPGTEQFRGQLSLANTQLAGYIVFQGDSVALTGRAWNAGPGTFHSHVTSTRGGSGYTIHVSFFDLRE